MSGAILVVVTACPNGGGLFCQSCCSSISSVCIASSVATSKKDTIPNSIWALGTFESESSRTNRRIYQKMPPKTQPGNPTKKPTLKRLHGRCPQPSPSRTQTSGSDAASYSTRTLRYRITMPSTRYAHKPPNPSPPKNKSSSTPKTASHASTPPNQFEPPYIKPDVLPKRSHTPANFSVKLGACPPELTRLLVSLSRMSSKRRERRGGPGSSGTAAGTAGPGPTSPASATLSAWERFRCNGWRLCCVGCGMVACFSCSSISAGTESALSEHPIVFLPH